MPFTLESLNVVLLLVTLFLCLFSFVGYFYLEPALWGLLYLVRAIGFVFRLTGAVLCLLWRIVRAPVRALAAGRRRLNKTTPPFLPLRLLRIRIQRQAFMRPGLPALRPP